MDDWQIAVPGGFFEQFQELSRAVSSSGTEKDMFAGFPWPKEAFQIFVKVHQKLGKP